VTFAVLTILLMVVSFLCDVMPCRLVYRYQHYGGTVASRDTWGRGGGGVHTSSETTLKTKHWYSYTTIHAFLCQKINMFLCIFCTILLQAVCEIYCSFIIFSRVP